MQILIGNILDSKMQTLVNTVNCVGVMGKGIAKDFKEKYPTMYSDYIFRCEKKLVKPGIPYLYKDLMGVSIINFPTKNHWRSPSKLEDIVKGLKIFLLKYKEWGIQSVAFPPLGCGNGGLLWQDVGPILYQALSKTDIPVEIYAPYGTSKEFLTKDFLNKRISTDRLSIQTKVQSYIKPEWACLLEIIYQLQKKQYAQPIGRMKYQKLCYALIDAGIPLGFNFIAGSYGPYSNEAKSALSVLANANLVAEQQLGSMIALNIGSSYPAFREKYKTELKKYESQIMKVFDLFCRLTNSEQAEEVATVLYTTRKLREGNPNRIIYEKDIFDEVITWKKHWNKPEKQDRIASAIRNLLILNWINVSLSDNLPIEDEIYI